MFRSFVGDRCILSVPVYILMVPSLVRVSVLVKVIGMKEVIPLRLVRLDILVVSAVVWVVVVLSVVVLVIIVVIKLIFVMVIISVSRWLGIVSSVDRLWVVVIISATVVLLWLIVMVVASPVLPSVVELCVSAGQDVSTGADHVWGEGKLLAVEDEEVSMLVEDALLAPAQLLEEVDLVSLVVNPVVDVLNIVSVMMDLVGV